MKNIYVEIPDILKSGEMLTILQKHVNKASEKIKNKLRKDVKEQHLYKHRTRKLRNASDVKELPKKADELLNLEVGVDLRKAPYGKYVIQGNGNGWEGDPFVQYAVQRNLSYIQKTIEGAINDAINEINRG